MIDRTRYNSEIEKLQLIASHYNDDLFAGITDSLCKERDLFEIKVVFSGHFNAGKSSLINALLGTDLLSVSQVPETAVVTEFHYSDENKLLAEDAQGMVHAVLSLSQVSPDKYSCVRCLLPNDALRELRDFTIVDTPGFDSYNIEHTKALDAYIGKGAVYFFVVDADKGGIDAESLRRLSDVYTYNKNVILLINKCDKQTDENIGAIKRSAEANLSGNFITCPVYCVSANSLDIGNTLKGIIMSIDPQQIFDDHMEKKLNYACAQMRLTIESILHSSYYSSYDDDSRIYNLESSMKDMSEQFDKECEEARTGISKSIDETMGEIKSALISRADQMVNPIKNNDILAKQGIIYEAVHPILRKAYRSIIPEQLRHIVQSLEFSDKTNNKEQETQSDFPQLCKDMISRYTDGMEMDSFLESDDLPIDGIPDGEDMAMVAKTILDIAMKYGKRIMDLVSSIIDKLTRNEHIKDTYVQEIVPQICMQISISLEDDMIEQFNRVITELKDEFEKKKNAIQAQLETLKQHRISSQADFETMQNTMKKDLDDLS